MPEFDIVIRGGTIATASDVYTADLGIRGGRIAAVGTALAEGRDEIDARGKFVLPGGIDAHCHLDQPSSDGSVCAVRFRCSAASLVAMDLMPAADEPLSAGVIP